VLLETPSQFSSVAYFPFKNFIFCKKAFANNINYDLRYRKVQGKLGMVAYVYHLSYAEDGGRKIIVQG
jgi:hypothetical protein